MGKLTKWLIICLLSFSQSLEAQLSDSAAEVWAKRVFDYQSAYSDLFRQCVPSRKSVGMFMDMANCMWTKEQTLLKKYRLEEVFYKVSYKRYSQLFDIGKRAGLEKGGWEYFAEMAINLEFDTAELQEELFKDYLRKQYQ